MSVGWFAFFFLISGLCSLVYQVVWLRLAMAAMGVTTPMISIVLSVFMAGLAIGSAGGGAVVGRSKNEGRSLTRLYGLLEIWIGLSAFVVPPLLDRASGMLANPGGSAAEWASPAYHALSGLSVAVILLPFCIPMGATFPLAMGAIRAIEPRLSGRSFSSLYFMNVVGATTGTIVSAFLTIEVVGLRGTMVFAAFLNTIIGATALVLGARVPDARRAPAETEPPAEADPARPIPGALAVLFLTGLAGMGLEVVWTRQLTPYVGTEVYAFASILAVYLAATFAGTSLYRWKVRAGGGADSTSLADLRPLAAGLILWASLVGALALAAADPRLVSPGGLLPSAVRVALGVAPFCLVLGMITPMLIDNWARGRGERAGPAYALNVVGCILGPLAAGFVLLPWMGERWSTLALLAPLFLTGTWQLARSAPVPASLARVGVVLALGLLLVTRTRDFETVFPRRAVLRDYSATVVAVGEGMQKRLYVNGVWMTHLTPIAKMMAHLPLALLHHPPREGLVICLGMGTAYRSMLSWGMRATAVELIPSVPRLLPYFQKDGARLLESPLGRIVVDDGRRFLDRTGQRFDVITIDPPPPITAAASSLLYSREFYEVAKRRLTPRGVLQQWIPAGDRATIAGVVRAFEEAFPYARYLPSIETLGLHCLGSMRPLTDGDGSELAGRLPDAALGDLLEWTPEGSAERMFQFMLDNEVTASRLMGRCPDAVAVRDDRPLNEYYLVRRLAQAGRTGCWVPIVSLSSLGLTRDP